jgi:aspartate aminotransferase-like enzyme
MPGLLPDIDPKGLLEFSVVFTDRSLNHMSQAFQGVMKDINEMLKDVYGAEAAVVVPGGGTFAMEAVARQFATDKRCLVLRNGWFSYRWSQIIDTGKISSDVTVLKARMIDDGDCAAFAPAPINEVTDRILVEKPDIVFAPHVETSSGIILPDSYIKQMSDAVRGVGGLMILDCVASGAIWVDMDELGVDVLISAPQKGWSASPCAGFVMLTSRGLQALSSTTSTSFACDLRKWFEIMEAYINGGHAYHATMPTDSLRKLRDTMKETEDYGFDKLRKEQEELGRKVRELLASRGFKSVAAEGFEAPGVVVSYTDNPDIRTGQLFAEQGMQIAAGVPLQCDEPESYSTFRLGLFGLDKLHNIERTVKQLEDVLDVL